MESEIQKQYQLFASKRLQSEGALRRQEEHQRENERASGGEIEYTTGFVVKYKKNTAKGKDLYNKL